MHDAPWIANGTRNVGELRAEAALRGIPSGGVLKEDLRAAILAHELARLGTPVTLPAPVINDPGILNLTVGTAFNQTLTAGAGILPLNWSAAGLPPGLSIDTATGTINGTPTTQGTYSALITVNDSATPARSNTQPVTFNVVPVVVPPIVPPVTPPVVPPIPVPATPPLRITTRNLPAARQLADYSGNVASTGGSNDHEFSITAGPTWLQIDVLTGDLTGTPGRNDTTEQVTVQVEDDNGVTAERIFNLRVEEAPQRTWEAIPWFPIVACAVGIAAVVAVLWMLSASGLFGWIADNTYRDGDDNGTQTEQPDNNPSTEARKNAQINQIIADFTSHKITVDQAVKKLKALGLNDQQITALGVKADGPNPNGSKLNNPADNPAAQDPCNATGSFGKPVADGTKLNEGNCAIVEVDNWSTKTSMIYAGALPQDFVVNDKATPQISGWTGYSSTKHACTDANNQKAAREADPVFKGFTFTVNCADAGKSGGQQAPKNGPMAPSPTSKSATRLTGTCGSNIPHSDQVMSVNIGEMLPKGTLAVVRTSNHADLEIFVEYGCLLADTMFDHVGLIAMDAWYGYSAVAKAQANACGEARARLNGSLMPKSWESGYTIHFLGTDGNYGDVPATCPAR